jgi:hypothetical protein
LYKENANLKKSDLFSKDVMFNSFLSASNKLGIERFLHYLYFTYANIYKKIYIYNCFDVDPAGKNFWEVMLNYIKQFPNDYFTPINSFQAKDLLEKYNKIPNLGVPVKDYNDLLKQLHIENEKKNNIVSSINNSSPSIL